MPLYKLTNEMPYDELLGWFAYFEQRPVGWRDDDRAFKLMQVQGFKGKGSQVFPSLLQLEQGLKPATVADTLKGSAVFNFMMNAKGGDSLQVLKEM